MAGPEATATVGEAAPAVDISPRVSVLGIRHHGPGSARSVLAALEELRPDMILIEGPADADALIPLAASNEMTPPVALLTYRPDAPRVSAFWPFALFSPEWQAIRWGADHQVTVRFCDLPSSILIDRGARKPRPDPSDSGAPGAVAADEPAGDSTAPDTDIGSPHTDFADLENPENTGDAGDDESPGTSLQSDPLAMLSAAAGYDDPERWWDDVIESRTTGVPPFEAITEAMTELRLATADRPPDRREQQREAHMRQVLREVLKAGAQRVAVVCGAWHAPALTGKLPTAAADARLLRGLPRTRMRVTWVPWTHSRLNQHSGYGAGIASPGWYHHLFDARDEPITRWMTKVARRLRTEDLPVSSAHVIEGVRLAEALATLRHRTLAGLAEVTEATLAVLCEGDELALDFVTRELVVGESMGAVPADTPSVPLAADLTDQMRRLRMKPDPVEHPVTLDLRKPTDLARSHLLHRLRALGIDWGEIDDEQSQGTGTFKENWSLQWRPEFAVDIIDASVWGTTLPSAAVARTVDRAVRATALSAVSALVEASLLADLPDALAPVLHELTHRAALTPDVTQLMSALPPLVRSARYGDVRGTDAAGLAAVVDSLLLRVCAGLPSAVGSLGDDAAAELKAILDRVHAAVLLRGSGPAVAAGRQQWLATLVGLVDRRDLHGLLAGRIVRLLLDAGVLDSTAAADRFRRALSYGSTVAAKSAWAEGFLSEDGLLLVHNRELLAIVDDWVTGLSDEDFADAVALLRRTFGGYASGERRTIGEQARRLGAGALTGEAAGRSDDLDIDAERAAPAVATVAALLGLAPW